MKYVIDDEKLSQEFTEGQSAKMNDVKMPMPGEVWQRKLFFNRVHVVNVSEAFVKCQIRDLEFKYIPILFFLDAYICIGKAKSTIKDLFEVQDDQKS